MSRAVAIVSGGLDSVTLAYQLHHDGYDLHLLAFDYGQRHRRELVSAWNCARALAARFTKIDMTSLTPILRGSALTGAVDVPEGRYAAPNMAQTVVPNRNAIMLAVAYTAAATDRADAVAIGVHGGDHYIYPDCRPAFIESFTEMERRALDGLGLPDVRLLAPFVHLTKADIVALGARLGVPFADTWSCYKGGAHHCGKCATCIERREAFAMAGVTDPTIYESGS